MVFSDAFQFIVFFTSGKPTGDRPVRLPGQVLHATLQEWEFTELHSRHEATGQPLYCQGIFDAITMGEVQIQYYQKKIFGHIPHGCDYRCGFKKIWKIESCRSSGESCYILSL